MTSSAAGAFALSQPAYWSGPGGETWATLDEVVDRALAAFSEPVLRAIGIAAGDRVLDVGCGAGALTSAAADRVGEGGFCLGVDLSEPLLERARARCVGRPQVRFERGDAATHPWPEPPFDTVVSRFGVMFFPDPVAALAHVRAGAREGAAGAFLTWRGAGENPVFSLAARLAGEFAELPPPTHGAPGQFAFADPERTRGVMEQAGWSQVRIEPVDVAARLPADDLLAFVTRLGPVGAVAADLDAGGRERLGVRAREVFGPFLQGGEGAFTGACWLLQARA